VTDPTRLHFDDLPAASTKLGCARQFARYPGPSMIAAAAAVTVARRVRMARFRWADLRVAAGVVLAHPFAEWAVHVHLLHRSQPGMDGQRRESFAARKHRRHHEDPKDVELVLLPPKVMAGLITGTLVIAASVPDRRRAATGAAVSLTSVLAYEWMHFLIHSPYQPRSGWYRSRWRAHRLHHYRNENYWFGVVSTRADRVLGTAPERDEVPVSPSALTLAS
jgi:hypothetical protein